MAQTLHSFTLNLLTNPQAMADYQVDASAALSAAGLADITPQDVQEIMPLVMDSVAANTVAGSLAGGPDGLHGGAGAVTPLGDLAALGSAHSGGGAFGVWSSQGNLAASASPSGMSIGGAFSPAGDLGGTLDAQALQGTASSLLASGAGSVAGLMTAGAAFSAGALGSAGTGVDGSADGSGDVGGGTFTVDGHHQSAADVPQGPIAAPVDLPAGLPHLPAGDLGALPLDLPQLPVNLPQLPVDVPQLPVDLPQVPVDLPVDGLSTAPSASVSGDADVSGAGSTGGLLGQPVDDATHLVHGIAPLDGLHL